MTMKGLAHRCLLVIHCMLYYKCKRIINGIEVKRNCLVQERLKTTLYEGKR